MYQELREGNHKDSWPPPTNGQQHGLIRETVFSGALNTVQVAKGDPKRQGLWFQSATVSALVISTLATIASLTQGVQIINTTLPLRLSRPDGAVVTIPWYAYMPAPGCELTVIEIY